MHSFWFQVCVQLAALCVRRCEYVYARVYMCRHFSQVIVSFPPVDGDEAVWKSMRMSRKVRS